MNVCKKPDSTATATESIGGKERERAKLMDEKTDMEIGL